MGAKKSKKDSRLNGIKKNYPRGYVNGDCVGVRASNQLENQTYFSIYCYTTKNFSDLLLSF